MSTKAGRLSPATLFLEYYILAGAWDATQRAVSEPPDPSFGDLAAGFLALADGAEAESRLRMLVDGKVTNIALYRGRVLAALQAIDTAFALIHPRSVMTSTTPPPSSWLQDARTERRFSGAYAATNAFRLITRGPLARVPRHLHATNGDHLADRFSALAVAPLSVVHDGRAIGVSMKIIGLDPWTGVPRGTRPGSETIGFVPIATARDQVDIREVDHTGRMFASYGAGVGFDSGAAALEALRALGKVDIAILPELALNECHIEWLADALSREPGPFPRLIVAGSSNTASLSTDGLAWNECRVLNARGRELWRQCKIWPAGIDRQRTILYGLPDPGVDSLTLEANAAGSEIVVADIEGLGRGIVLICQDCEMEVATPALIAAYQPDWIFTPIFDCSIDEGRWTHARAFGLSTLSQARCIAVTNAAFGGVGANIGIAVGPKQVAVDHMDDVDRAVHIVKLSAVSPPAAEIVGWRSGTWQQTWLTSRDSA